jgi:hypothetical protein
MPTAVELASKIDRIPSSRRETLPITPRRPSPTQRIVFVVTVLGIIQTVSEGFFALSTSIEQFCKDEFQKGPHQQPFSLGRNDAILLNEVI